MNAGYASIVLIGLFFAQSSMGCTATNDNDDHQCQTYCFAGQIAHCVNGTGSSAPECYCTDQ